MLRIHARMRAERSASGLPDRRQRGVRAALGMILVLLTLGAVVPHGHGAEFNPANAASLVSSSDDGPASSHGSGRVGDPGCAFCEAGRRGELEEGVPSSTSVFASARDRAAGSLSDLVSAPRAPARSGSSPRAPPVSV